MKWLLVVLITSMNAPLPLTVLQIQVASKELCERAGEQIRKDFVGPDAGTPERGSLIRTLYGRGGVITSCIQISN